jgi:hypothetical protein
MGSTTALAAADKRASGRLRFWQRLTALERSWCWHFRSSNPTLSQKLKDNGQLPRKDVATRPSATRKWHVNICENKYLHYYNIVV